MSEVWSFLERQLAELRRDGDPAQRGWKLEHTLAGLDAYERAGVMPAGEASRWRERLQQPEDVVSGLKPATRAAADAHLQRLLDGLTVMARGADQEARRRNAEYDAAVQALYAVGVLDEPQRARWVRDGWRRRAPWLEETPDPASNQLVSVRVPPRDAAEAAADRSREETVAFITAPRSARAVVLGDPQRRNGLAIVALVVYDDAVIVHFHRLGDVMPADEDPFARMRRQRDADPPPDLADDTGASYAPAWDKPISGSGPGVRPGRTGDPPLREARSGAWLYRPAPAPAAGLFTVRRGDDIWSLSRAGR